MIKIKFDDVIHRIDKTDIEFWYARELMPLLGYERWENFENAVKRAMESCETSAITASDHFREVTKMITAGKGDQALFDGHSTQEMKSRLGIKNSVESNQKNFRRQRISKNWNAV